MENDMFTHILLPTDGSPLSESAIAQGIRLAKAVNARVTGLYVMPQFHVFTYRTEMLEDTREQNAKDCNAHAAEYLAFIEKTAKEAVVTSGTISVSDDHPDEAIIKAAAEQGCDLIVMASHGRHGVAGVLMGSVTQKVLTHGKVPVLVCH
jgi:nucleotide-binding universal stress UspA family protein